MAQNLGAKPIKNRPRLRTLEPRDGERHASWLELFFDLVFVLAVAQVAHMLSGHSDLFGFVKFAALFVPVWWCWIGFTFYADRFETEETIYRVLMFAGMFAVAALSLCLNAAFSINGDLPFIFCYVLVRVVLIALYIRSAYHIPLARSFCLQFVAGFSVASGLLLISLFFAPPLRYAIWALALVVELVTPFVDPKATRIFPIDRSHIPERFGLFTIIVLGEAVVSAANGAAKVEWNFSTIGTATLGFVIATSIWWINFDFVEDSAIKSRSLVPRFVYMFGHFFIVSSIVVIGIGVEHAIKDSAVSDHLTFSTAALLCGGVSVFFAIITIIRFSLGVCRLFYPRLASIALALITLFAGQSIPALVVLSVLAGLMIIGIILENRFAEEEDSEETDELAPCEHADEMRVFTKRSTDGCEECVKNNYKWVHLRLCLSCGHVGCCDTSIHKHATKHFHAENHPVSASLEPGENWAWCYVDERFVPLTKEVGD